MDVFLAAIVGIGVAVALWRPFFDDWEGFLGCIRYWITPDAWSFFKGEYGEDHWAEMKLGAWLVISFLAAFGTYSALQ